MATFAASFSSGPEAGDSTNSSDASDWSDEEGDEYLARVLAGDEYLQGSGLPSSAAAGAEHEEDRTKAMTPQGAFSGSVPYAEGSGRDIAGGAQQISGTTLIHHPACELHCIPDHPERPARIRAIMNSLMRRFPRIRTLLAPEATIEQVTRFHSRSYVDEILRMCADSERRAELATSGNGREGKKNGRRSSGGGRGGMVFIDSDTAIMRSSREAIMRAAGAACKAVDEVMSGRAVNTFCCVRPPGHHAEPDRAMGFCFFNNAPIGALHAQAKHGVERVAVVDFDVHHGNGTQAHFEKYPDLFYASTHQGPEFYPGTGYDSIKGVATNIVNVSMRGGEGSEGFRRAYSRKILPALEEFRPGLIVISAGFDAHKDDPLAGIALDAEDYRWVTEEICDIADRVCHSRVVSVLEGGYSLRAISDSAVAHVRALVDASASSAAEAAYEAAASRLAERMGTASVTARDPAPAEAHTSAGLIPSAEANDPGVRGARAAPALDRHERSSAIPVGQCTAEASGDLRVPVSGAGVSLTASESEALYETLLAAAAGQDSSGAGSVAGHPGSLWEDDEDDPIEGLLDRLTIDCEREAQAEGEARVEGGARAGGALEACPDPSTAT